MEKNAPSRLEDTPSTKVKLAFEANGFYNELLVALESITIREGLFYDAFILLGNDKIQFYSLVDNNRFAIQGIPIEHFLLKKRDWK